MNDTAAQPLGLDKLREAFDATGKADAASAGELAGDALRKLCDQLDGMKRRIRHTPGTGQYHSYLLAEDVDAFVGKARETLAGLLSGSQATANLGAAIDRKCEEARAVIGEPWGYNTPDSIDAARYRRLRIIGAAPGGSTQLAGGTVLCFQNLDAFVDADLDAHPSRGEYQSAATSAADAKDADRLNFLDTNARFRMGWEVGAAPVGNLSVRAIITGGLPIREAIDKAMAAAPSSEIGGVK